MQRTIALAPALFLVACGGADAKAPSAPVAPTAPGPATVTAEFSAPIEIPTGTPNCPELATELTTLELPAASPITLLTPGAEPRHELRYRPALGAHSSFLYRTDTDRSITPAKGASVELASPRIVMTLVTDVVDVRDDGSFVIRRVVDQAALEERDGVDAKSRAAAEGAIAGTSCLVVEERVDARGVVLDARSSGGALAVDQLRHVLPAEPVGDGATWEVREQRRQAGLILDLVTTYELKVIEGMPHVGADSKVSVALDPSQHPGVELLGSTAQAGFAGFLDLATMTPTGSGGLTAVLDIREGKRRSQHVVNVTAWFAPE